MTNQEISQMLADEITASIENLLSHADVAYTLHEYAIENKLTLSSIDIDQVLEKTKSQLEDLIRTEIESAQERELEFAEDEE